MSHNICIAFLVMRPPMNFTLNAHRSPNPETFLGATQSNSLLNNDDDWEALMEVSTTDEAEKIRALVGDKALPTTDPNQCLLCRRVLSCKSALQMHYRTHTGECVCLFIYLFVEGKFFQIFQKIKFFN